MSRRTVIITGQAKLDYKMGLMTVRGEETKKVVVDEIAVLVIENPAMWRILESTVYVDGMRRSVSDAIKIYTRSVFEAINDKDASEIKHYTADPESDYIIDI